VDIELDFNMEVLERAVKLRFSMPLKFSSSMSPFIKLIHKAVIAASRLMPVKEHKTEN
jgi:hypothetical protein